MKTKPRLEEHHKKETWTNPTTDPLRREECLCLNCGEFKPGKNNCPFAKKLYEVCVKAKIALMVTRCGYWEPKPEQNTQETDENTGLRVELQDEIVSMDRPAKVQVYDGDKLIATVTTKVTRQGGADGGQYPAVELTLEEEPGNGS